MLYTRVDKSNEIRKTICRMLYSIKLIYFARYFTPFVFLLGWFVVRRANNCRGRSYKDALDLVT